jgi:hypothetical protein
MSCILPVRGGITRGCYFEWRVKLRPAAAGCYTDDILCHKYMHLDTD